MLKHLVIIGLSGAAGTLLRYGVFKWLGTHGFPWATLCVNALGSFIMGVLFVLMYEKGVLSESLRPYMMTAFLGAFTTFSAFSLEGVQMLQQGQWYLALSYVMTSVILCFALVGLGMWSMRTFV